MKASVIYRQIEICPRCGAWESFRKGPSGKTLVDKRTGLKRIYGVCSKCETPLVVQYVLNGLNDKNETAHRSKNTSI